MKTQSSAALASGEVAGAMEAPGAGAGHAVVVRRVGADTTERRVDPSTELGAGEATKGVPTEGAVDLGFAAVREAEGLAMALTPAQRLAIERLTSGSTAVDAARTAGVCRATLYKWLKDDAAFVAAYNAWQRDMLATARGKMLALTDVALAALGKAMARGDGKLALRVLERLGIADRPEPGETDVEEVRRVQEQERRRQQIAAAAVEEQLVQDQIMGAYGETGRDAVEKARKKGRG